MLQNQRFPPRLNVLREIAFLLIILLSTLTSIFYLPYVTYGPSLIQDNFTAGGTGWKTADGNRVQPGQGPANVNNKSRDSSASLSLVVHPPAGADHVLLSARARSQNVVPGTHPWNLARLILLPYHRNSVEPDHRGTETLFMLTGTTNWAEYSQFFHVPDGIAYWKLQAQLSHASGALDLDAIELHAATYKKSWLPMQLMAISLGFIFLAIIFSPYYVHRKDHREIAALVCVALIVISTTIPATLKADIYELLVSALTLVPSAMASNIGQDASDILTGDTLLFFAWMHFSLFTITSWLLLTGMPTRSVSGKLYDVLTLAVVTECLQVFVSDRSPSLLDVTIDMAGAISGLTAYCLWRTAASRLNSD